MMSTLLRKLRQAISIRKGRTKLNPKANPLAVEELEPRVLLNADWGLCSWGDSLELTVIDDNNSISDYVVEEPQEYQASGYKWPQPGGLGSFVTITYSYSNLLGGGLPGGLSSTLLRAATEEAFGLWAQYAPLRFVEMIDSGPIPTDSHTNYSAENHPDIRIGHHYIDGSETSPNTLAHAFYPTGHGLGGDVHFDNGDSWEIGNVISTAFDFLEVATHEIGHSLGLDHETTNTAIMNPILGERFNGLGTGFLFQDDIDGIRAIYGLLDAIPPSAPGFPDLITDTGSSANDDITNDNTPTFIWSASTDNPDGQGVASYQWRVDGQNWSNWQTTLNTTVPSLIDGAHVFHVRAKDHAGNIGSASSLTFIIDTMNPSSPGMPDLITDSGFSETDNITNVSTLTFNWAASIDDFNGSGVDGYQWRVDGQYWSSRQTLLSATVHTLSDGTHQFYVRAKDHAGNIGSATRLTFVIDTILPNVPRLPNLITDSGTSASDNITNDDTLTFNWFASTDNNKGSGVSSYQWRVDGQDWSSRQTILSATVDTLSDGTHQFYVRAEDYAGNISPASSLTFIIDTIKPSSPGMPDLITDSGFSETDNITNVSTSTFNWAASIDDFNGSGVNGYQWRVDGQDWSSRQTLLSATVHTLSDGTHQFYVRAEDYAGNISPASSLTFIIDTINPSSPGMPDLITDSGFSETDNITNVSTSTFNWAASIDDFNGSGVDGYQWRVDYGGWSSLQTTLDTNTFSLVNGTHIFFVRAKDKAGNIGSARSLEFVVDNVGPNVVDASPLGELTNNLDYLDVSFNEPIDSGAFGSDAAQGTGPNGSFQSTGIVQLAETSYRIQFNKQDATGDYTIVIGPGIADLAGNIMDQPFEGNIFLTLQVLAGTDAAKKISYYDSDDSLVTVQVTNGKAVVAFGGPNLKEVNEQKGVLITGDKIQIANIAVITWGHTTKITVKAKGGNNQADLGGITGNYLSSLNAKGINLVGDIDLTGSLGSMMVNDIHEDVTITTGRATFKGFRLKAGRIGDNVVFDIDDAVRSFQAESFSSGALVAINVGQVKIKSGQFGADVKAKNGDILGITTTDDISGDITASGTIKKITTKLGSFTGVARAGNEIGTIQAYNLQGAIISSGKDIQKVNIRKDILETYIVAGYDVNTDFAFGLQEAGGGDLPGSGNVGSVTAKGQFARSYICAGTLPNSPLTDVALLDVGLPYVGNYGSVGKVKFGSVDFNATVDFGLFAATEIKPFKIGRSVAQSEGHFRVEILS